MKSDNQSAVVITGASGFIGTALTSQLLAEGQRVIGLSRRPDRLAKRLPGLETVSDLSQIASETPVTTIINLAGEPILDARWSEQRKQRLYRSRLDTTAAVTSLIERLASPPAVLISGSAIGFYGSVEGDRVVIEGDDGHPCFAHSLCRDWEQAALAAETRGVRVCLLRTGVVLGKGGALKRMLPPFRFGLGGPIGNGRQWMSWIHLKDEVRAVRYLMDHEVLSGAFNLTAPEPVTNSQFTRALAKALHRPAVLPMPAWVLNLALGEGATLLTEGQRVVPRRLQDAGFEFEYKTLPHALEQILS